MLIADKTLKDTISFIVAEFSRQLKVLGREAAYQHAKSQLFGISKLLIGRKEHGYTDKAIQHLNELNDRLKKAEAKAAQAA